MKRARGKDEAVDRSYVSELFSHANTSSQRQPYNFNHIKFALSRESKARLLPSGFSYQHTTQHHPPPPPITDRPPFAHRHCVCLFVCNEYLQVVPWVFSANKLKNCSALKQNKYLSNNKDSAAKAAATPPPPRPTPSSRFSRVFFSRLAKNLFG